MSVASKTLITTLIAASAAAVSGPSAHPSVIWNTSPSVPTGLYRVRLDPTPAVNDIVVVRPPEDLAWFLAEGGYLPRHVPLLKRVAALAGARVCRFGLTVSIDGKAVAEALQRDHRGRPLPTWSGCIVLTDAQVFLLSTDRPDSLDGRYFGPLDRSAIVGRAAPVWIAGEK